MPLIKISDKVTWTCRIRSANGGYPVEYHGKHARAGEPMRGTDSPFPGIYEVSEEVAEAARRAGANVEVLTAVASAPANGLASPLEGTRRDRAAPVPVPSHYPQWQPSDE
jgi:hypothetical protein